MRRRILIASLILLFFAAVTIIVYRVFFLKLVRVPTGSMANTIIPGDHLIVKRLFGEVARGDIVVFRYPKEPSTYYVARVIGMSGETIEIRDRSVYLTGKELSEVRVTVKPDIDFKSPVLEELSSEGSGPYRVFYFQRDETTKDSLQSDYQDASFGTDSPFRIPDNQYFVMGDNRDNSYDSRFNGPVPRHLIWGNATLIYWSSYGRPSQDEEIRWDRIGKRVR